VRIAELYVGTIEELSELVRFSEDELGLPMSRPIILCFLNYYLPGFRGGGPARSVRNLVDALSEEYEFRIVTRDRDVGSDAPYESVDIGTWNRVGPAHVFYAPDRELSFRDIEDLLANMPHDVLYLNSFWNPRFTGTPLLIRRLGSCLRRPVVVAPRGEFSPGALAIKASRKRVYLAFAKLFGLFNEVTWQASSEKEASEIRCALGGLACRVLVAPNLVNMQEGGVSIAGAARMPAHPNGRLRLVYLSRLTRKKNLLFLLQRLGQVRSQVDLTIYGPTEDEEYWQDCLTLIGNLPRNITVRYAGEIEPEEVPAALAEHDVFVFPTRGENFGHVIFEALSAGTSVVVSDRTPWRPDCRGALEVLSLEHPSGWTEAIERWASLTPAEYATRRDAAQDWARQYVTESGALEQNRALFRAVASGWKGRAPCAV